MKKQIMLAMSILALGTVMNTTDGDSFEEVENVTVQENKSFDEIKKVEKIEKIELVEEVELVELVEEIEEMVEIEEVKEIEEIKEVETLEEVEFEEEFTDEELADEIAFQKWIEEFDLKEYKVAVTAYEIYRDEFLFTDGKDLNILINQTDLRFNIYDGQDYFIRTNTAETEIVEYELVETITLNEYRELHSGQNRIKNYELGKKMIHEQEPKDWIHAPTNEFEQDFEEVEEIEEVEETVEIEEVEELEVENDVELELETDDEFELEQEDVQELEEEESNE